MWAITPEQLRQRYAQLETEQLLALRARGPDLTADAHAALARELESRGVAPPPIPAASTPRTATNASDIGFWLLAGLAAAIGVIGLLRTDDVRFPALALLVVGLIRVALYRRRRREAGRERS